MSTSITGWIANRTRKYPVLGSTILLLFVPLLLYPMVSSGAGGGGGKPECRVDSDCDNGNDCDGQEVCLNRTCVADTPLAVGDICSLNQSDLGRCTQDQECVVECVPPDDTPCDDGNICDGFDICDTRYICEDGFVPPEGTLCQLEDGSTGECINEECVPSTVCVCGDGVTECGEECDDGNDINSDSCTNECKQAFCGDNIRWTTQCDPDKCEDCDDGNSVNEDACTKECDNPFCGDAIVWKYECDPATECEDCDGGIDCTDACDWVCICDEDCDDGNWCDGMETCDDHICIEGQPEDCDDEDPCTRDTCNSDAARCDNLAIDDDGDGYAPAPVCGEDCDDRNSSVNPDQTSFFTYPVPDTSSYDWNCDDVEEKQIQISIDGCPLSWLGCDTPALRWYRTIPACGESGQTISCVWMDDELGTYCKFIGLHDRTQACR